MKRAGSLHHLAAPLLGVLLVCSPGTGRAQVASSVLQFDQLVRNYNAIAFDNADLTTINNDTEGPLAIGGNLTVGGVPLVTFNQFESSPDPTLYVAGTFNVTANFAQLNSGYASLPGNAGLGAWNPATKRYTTPQGGVLDSTNASNPVSAGDPRTNPAPAGWNFTSLRTQFIGLSTQLRSAPATGTISVGNNQLNFSGAAHGVTVFTLDANLLSGNTYGAGQAFSNLGLNIGTDALYVVNVLNASGRTIFGGNGINFNLPADGGAGRLLWNIAPGAGAETTVTLGNGGQFYGSVLAPEIDLQNTLNTAFNGQVVAESLLYTNAELHYIAFAPPTSLIPEPSTYALVTGLLALAAVLRRSRPA